MTRHVALMRGINVGGKNKLPMRDLTSIFEDLGCTDVATCIQSGNVVFSASAALARSIPEKVQQQVQDRFAITSPVITRSARQINAAIAAIPFDEATCIVLFLASKPTPKAAAALDPNRSPGDRFKLVGREVYVDLPNGAARTRLTNAYFDATLQTISTGRNCRTVRRLAEMLGP